MDGGAIPLSEPLRLRRNKGWPQSLRLLRHLSDLEPGPH